MSENDLLKKHLSSAPPNVQAANENITPEMGELVRRMMAKKPEDRPESMSRFLSEFRSIRLYKRSAAAR